MCVISLFIDKKNKALPSSLEKMKDGEKVVSKPKTVGKNSWDF